MKQLKDFTAAMCCDLGPAVAAFFTILLAFLALLFAACFAVLMYISWPIGPAVAAVVIYTWWRLYRWYAKEDR